LQVRCATIKIKIKIKIKNLMGAFVALQSRFNS